MPSAEGTQFLIPPDVYQWFREWDGEPEGYEKVHEDADPGKHDASNITEVFKHSASGRFLEVSYSRSYNYGWDEYSFSAREVFPHTITTTVYKTEPQA